jgi:predicted nucleic acid-binding protein
MGNNVLSQSAAWDVYDDWLENGHAVAIEEPSSIDPVFRSLSRSGHTAPKDWADSYVAAFAQVSGLHLVTFDQALHRRIDGSLLLKS